MIVYSGGWCGVVWCGAVRCEMGRTEPHSTAQADNIDFLELGATDYTPYPPTPLPP